MDRIETFDVVDSLAKDELTVTSVVIYHRYNCVRVDFSVKELPTVEVDGEPTELVVDGEVIVPWNEEPEEGERVLEEAERYDDVEVVSFGEELRGGTRFYSVELETN